METNKNYYRCILRRNKSYHKITFQLILAAGLIVIICFLLSSSASAHRMIIKEQIEEGKVQILYEGNIPAARAVVTIYDNKKNIIAEGPVDYNGYFHFEPSTDIAFLEAQDGLGHLARLNLSRQSSRIENLPLPKRVAAGILILAIVAFISYWQIKKKKIKALFLK